MGIFPRLVLSSLLLAAAISLSGCESSEDRAERYYKSALSFIEAGDEDRAVVELRNVFQYNGFHKEARKTYADIQLKRGNIQEAYSQYLLLVEQFPDMSDARRTLAEIAISAGNWNEAERHGLAAYQLAPEEPGVIAIKAALDQHAAQLSGDVALEQGAVAAARKVITDEPANIVARRVVIESLLRGPNPPDALPELDAAIAVAPEMLELHVLKLQILLQGTDAAAVGAQLQDMSERFPDNERVRAGLVSWYLDQGDVDAAEQYLRAVSQRMGDDPTAQMNVVRLLQEARSPAAAQAELDSLIASHADKPNADIYRSLRASIDFENGRREEALTAMRAIVAAAPESDQSRSIKVMLAKMLEISGGSPEARTLVDDVLAQDVSNVEALKMRAGWLIDADKPGEAIVALRTALDQSPRDPTILLLMATAHERDGSPELAGERLALAVEVSGSAPDESLRYAAFLLQTGNDLSAARKVLIDAIANAPENLDIIRALAQIVIQQRDWALANELVRTLQSMSGDEAVRTANGIRTAVLLGQEKTEESIQFLQGLIDKGQGDVSSIALIVQTRIRLGKTSEARAYLDQAMAKQPDNAGLQFLSGSLFSLMGEPKKAEAVFRDLIAKQPSAESVVQALYGLLKEQGRPQDAAKLLESALISSPTSVVLRWMKATEHEVSGDTEGAIAIYEQLYAEDSNNLVIANNLASLLAASRTDAESLERAYAVARRLRDNPTPAFQDTLGWIEFRRGNAEAAVRSLKPAAAQLLSDPVVQAHLGLAYEATGNAADAKTTLARALDMAGDDPAPVFQMAKDALARLDAAKPTTP